MTDTNRFPALNTLEEMALHYMDQAGPVFEAKLAKRLDVTVPEIREAIRLLQDKGYVERVKSTLVHYRLNKRNKVTKHRNHTYYGLTRLGRHYFRRGRERPEVNLRPPYKQA